MMMLKRIGEKGAALENPKRKVERPGGKQARDVDYD